ncbi:MAG TPA: L-lactate permease [Pseudonocardia sp.]|nr:L-lactate permease [Pseudonocardia sp.]
MLADYTQVPDPLGHSLALSSVVAALPLVVLFVLLGVVRMRAWLASVIGLLTALVVAIVFYAMPALDAVNSGLLGAAFGFFPIMWIVINAIWVYNLTVETGHFDVLRKSFASISDDQRIQAIIIAFCFGALMEALAGFGTPVAISSVMLIALGFRPLKAATVALVANTAPVAFGALAVPITTLATVTRLPVEDLGAMVGRQTPILAVFVPLALVLIVDGKRGMRDVWPVALLCGVVFGIFQFLASNYWSIPLTDIIAALASALAVLAFTRVWHPRHAYSETHSGDAIDDAQSPDVERGTTPAGGPTAATVTDTRTDVDRPALVGRAEVMRAYAPYLIIVVVFVIATRIPAITGVAPTKPGASGTGLEAATWIYNWPGLHIISSTGKVIATTFKLNLLSAAGTLLLFAGLLTMAALKVGVGHAVRTYGRTLAQLKFAIVTVMSVLALGFVMNESGQTQTLGLWLAGAGAMFALLSPILGWLGVAVTGSDTSSNSLFGALQVSAASSAHLSPTLLAAANSSGGVLGKMISPQNLAIAAGAVGLDGREGEIFRRAIGWSVGFLVLMCVLVYLQSTPVLSWMVR